MNFQANEIAIVNEGRDFQGQTNIFSLDCREWISGTLAACDGRTGSEWHSLANNDLGFFILHRRYAWRRQQIHI